MATRKTRAASFSIASNSTLIVMKAAVGFVTGSVSILAEAIHSTLDLVAAVIAFFGVKASDKPADATHPYGHGKWENVSGTVEAVLIFVAAIWIIYEAINRLIEGSAPEMLEWGVVIMGVSVVANTLVSRYLKKIARETDSVALEADASHLTTDVITSAGVLLGLLLAKLTGWSVLDPIVALLVALLIIKAAWDILNKSFGALVDARLPKEEVDAISSLINEHTSKLVEFHNLRTRKAGSYRYVDLHLVMPKTLSVEKAHSICDHLEKDLKDKLKIDYVTIHVEPCTEENCPECQINCKKRPSDLANPEDTP
ncbi:cation transporter [Dehalococcoides mccartyi CG4]|uniref:cation diffusion facilitator family transporter n=1 Tax=Dehalococcoides mccartyi TaxID=61435 RepID=UPI0004E0858A|nr:cation diffusion facilitator family transporter [Dehalococcoides mccartyi]AII59028.1 cation transporter [Dehalococcoides mccartyi CG4]